MEFLYRVRGGIFLLALALAWNVVFTIFGHKPCLVHTRAFLPVLVIMMLVLPLPILFDYWTLAKTRGQSDEEVQNVSLWRTSAYAFVLAFWAIVFCPGG